MQFRYLIKQGFLYSLPVVIFFQIQNYISISPVFAWIMSGLLFLILMIRHTTNVRKYLSGPSMWLSPLLIILLSLLFFVLITVVFMGIYYSILQGKLSFGLDVVVAEFPSIIVQLVSMIIVSVIPAVVAYVMLMTQQSSNNDESQLLDDILINKK